MQACAAGMTRHLPSGHIVLANNRSHLADAPLYVMHWNLLRALDYEAVSPICSCSCLQSLCEALKVRCGACSSSLLTTITSGRSRPEHELFAGSLAQLR